VYACVCVRALTIAYCAALNAWPALSSPNIFISANGISYRRRVLSLSITRWLAWLIVNESLQYHTSDFLRVLYACAHTSRQGPAAATDVDEDDEGEKIHGAAVSVIS